MDAYEDPIPIIEPEPPALDPEPLPEPLPNPGPVNEAPVVLTRTGRQLRAPKAFQDFNCHHLNGLSTHVPRPPPKVSKRRARAVPEVPSSPSPPSPTPDPPEEIALPIEYETELNDFGVFRMYTRIPKHDPEEELTSHDICDHPNFGPSDIPHTSPAVALGRELPASDVSDDSESSEWEDLDESEDDLGPFENYSSLCVMNWHYSGSEIKSAGETNRLVKDVLLDPDFKLEDLHSFDFAKEGQRIDNAVNTSKTDFAEKDGWRTGSVQIHVPYEGKSFTSEEDAPVFEVGGIVYRRLIEVIKAANEDPVAFQHHYIPYKLYCRHPAQTAPPGSSATPASEPNTDAPPETKETRLYGEAYVADAILEEDARLQEQPREPGDPEDLEYAICPIYIASDSTRVAKFGHHSLWPIYLFFACFSKYFRGRPTSFAAHHLAYIPSVCVLHLSR